ncbi:type VI secretion system baseplate subunit TssK, partial [Pseudomonas aeruginosa]|nr:type VI secretion system baseplate subunit TssK [Pseudomonas aeruginosa]
RQRLPAHLKVGAVEHIRQLVNLHLPGVAVRLQRYAGCWHVFQAHAGVLASADRALDEAAAFVVECSAEGGQCRTS